MPAQGEAEAVVGLRGGHLGRGLLGHGVAGCCDGCWLLGLDWSSRTRVERETLARHSAVNGTTQPQNAP